MIRLSLVLVGLDSGKPLIGHVGARYLRQLRSRPDGRKDAPGQPRTSDTS